MKLQRPITMSTQSFYSTVPVSPATLFPSLPSASLLSSSSPFIFGSGVQQQAAFTFTVTFPFMSTPEPEVADVDMEDAIDEDDDVEMEDARGATSIIDAEVYRTEIDSSRYPSAPSTSPRRKRRHEEIDFDPVKAAINDITSRMEAMTVRCETKPSISDEVMLDVENMQLSKRPRRC